MKLLIILILVFSTSSFNLFGQVSELVDSEIKKEIVNTKGEDFYKLIIKNRGEIGTLKRMDSIIFSEMILIEKYDSASKEFYVSEFYISDSISQDTTVYVNGTKYNYAINSVFEDIIFSKNLKENKSDYKTFIRVKTGGCIRMPKRYIKRRMKSDLKNTFTIKSKINNDGIEAVAFEYPVKKPLIIIYKRTHAGGF
jgi:hypothetical protein